MARNWSGDFINQLIGGAELQLLKRESGMSEDELYELLVKGYEATNLESLGIDGKPYSVYGDGSPEQQYIRAVTRAAQTDGRQDDAARKAVRLLRKAQKETDPEARDALLTRVRRLQEEIKGSQGPVDARINQQTEPMSNADRLKSAVQRLAAASNRVVEVPGTAATNNTGQVPLLGMDGLPGETDKDDEDAALRNAFGASVSDQRSESDDDANYEVQDYDVEAERIDRGNNVKVKGFPSIYVPDGEKTSDVIDAKIQNLELEKQRSSPTRASYIQDHIDALELTRDSQEGAVFSARDKMPVEFMQRADAEADDFDITGKSSFRLFPEGDDRVMEMVPVRDGFVYPAGVVRQVDQTAVGQNLSQAGVNAIDAEVNALVEAGTLAPEQANALRELKLQAQGVADAKAIRARVDAAQSPVVQRINAEKAARDFAVVSQSPGAANLTRIRDLVIPDAYTPDPRSGFYRGTNIEIEPATSGEQIKFKVDGNTTPWREQAYDRILGEAVLGEDGQYRTGAGEVIRTYTPSPEFDEDYTPFTPIPGGGREMSREELSDQRLLDEQLKTARQQGLQGTGALARDYIAKVRGIDQAAAQDLLDRRKLHLGVGLSARQVLDLRPLPTISGQEVQVDISGTLAEANRKFQVRLNDPTVSIFDDASLDEAAYRVNTSEKDPSGNIRYFPASKDGSPTYARNAQVGGEGVRRITTNNFHNSSYEGVAPGVLEAMNAVGMDKNEIDNVVRALKVTEQASFGRPAISTRRTTTEGPEFIEGIRDDGSVVRVPRLVTVTREDGDPYVTFRDKPKVASLAEVDEAIRNLDAGASVADAYARLNPGNQNVDIDRTLGVRGFDASLFGRKGGLFNSLSGDAGGRGGAIIGAPAGQTGAMTDPSQLGGAGRNQTGQTGFGLLTADSVGKSEAQIGLDKIGAIFKTKVTFEDIPALQQAEQRYDNDIATVAPQVEAELGISFNDLKEKEKVNFISQVTGKPVKQVSQERLAKVALTSARTVVSQAKAARTPLDSLVTISRPELEAASAPMGINITANPEADPNNRGLQDALAIESDRRRIDAQMQGIEEGEIARIAVEGARFPGPVELVQGEDGRYVQRVLPPGRGSGFPMEPANTNPAFQIGATVRPIRGRGDNAQVIVVDPVTGESGVFMAKDGTRVSKKTKPVLNPATGQMYPKQQGLQFPGFQEIPQGSTPAVDAFLQQNPGVLQDAVQRYEQRAERKYSPEDIPRADPQPQDRIAAEIQSRKPALPPTDYEVPKTVKRNDSIGPRISQPNPNDPMIAAQARRIGKTVNSPVSEEAARRKDVYDRVAAKSVDQLPQVFKPDGAEDPGSFIDSKTGVRITYGGGSAGDATRRPSVPAPNTPMVEDPWDTVSVPARAQAPDVVPPNYNVEMPPSLPPSRRQDDVKREVITRREERGQGASNRRNPFARRGLVRNLGLGALAAGGAAAGGAGISSLINNEREQREQN